MLKPFGTSSDGGTSTLISNRPLSMFAVRSADSVRNCGVAAARTTVASSLLLLPHAVTPSAARAEAAGMATKVRNGLRDTKSSYTSEATCSGEAVGTLEQRVLL